MASSGVHARPQTEEEERLLEDDLSQSDSPPGLEPLPSLTTHIVYFMSIHFLLAFCEMVLVAPLLRLFENSLCLSHYGFPAEGVTESLCKIAEIQHPLATIRGWKSMFDTIPGTSMLKFKKILVLIYISSSCCYSNRATRGPPRPPEDNGSVLNRCCSVTC